MARRTSIASAVALGGVAFAAGSAAQPIRSTACDVRATRAALCRFVAALDNDEPARFVAPGRRFRRYTVRGPAGTDARSRPALTAYLSERRRHSEQLMLTWFSFSRSGHGTASFRFDVVRSADDLPVPTLYCGTAALGCATRCRLVTLTIAPNTEPRLPAPQTYAETCRLVGTWCEVQPSPGGVPDTLRRPPAFPTVAPGAECPVTTTGTQVVFDSLADPQFGPGDTINGRDGWREWPGGTYLRTPGCYAWQFDGTDFSNVIVFEAVFP